MQTFSSGGFCFREGSRPTSAHFALMPSCGALTLAAYITTECALNFAWSNMQTGGQHHGNASLHNQIAKRAQGKRARGSDKGTKCKGSSRTFAAFTVRTHASRAHNAQHTAKLSFGLQAHCARGLYLSRSRRRRNVHQVKQRRESVRVDALVDSTACTHCTLYKALRVCTRLSQGERLYDRKPCTLG